jgi:hypothetical protein
MMSKQPRLDRRVANAVYRNSFGAFVYAAFKVVNPGLELEENWHIDYVCHYGGNDDQCGNDDHRPEAETSRLQPAAAHSQIIYCVNRSSGFASGP